MMNEIKKEQLNAYNTIIDGTKITFPECRMHEAGRAYYLLSESPHQMKPLFYQTGTRAFKDENDIYTNH